VLNAGANVILTTGGMDDVANKYLVQAGVMGLRRVSKGDLRRIAKCSGATVLTSLSTIEGDESFDPAHLGSAKKVFEQAVGDNDFIFFE
jgi:T-complex protein 1 subunit alpha